MTEGTFEPQSPMFVTGKIAAEVVDTGQNPSTIIRVGELWYVHVTWSMVGPWVPTINGTWYVSVLEESMGQGPEGSLVNAESVPVNSVPLGTNPFSRSYDQYFPIPSTALPAGAFKLVTVLTIKDSNGFPVPMAAFCEGPIVQIY